MKIIIINYGAGNIQSIKFALKRLGYDAILSDKKLYVYHVLFVDKALVT